MGSSRDFQPFRGICFRGTKNAPQLSSKISAPPPGSIAKPDFAGEQEPALGLNFLFGKMRNLYRGKSPIGKTRPAGSNFFKTHLQKKDNGKSGWQPPNVQFIQSWRSLKGFFHSPKDRCFIEQKCSWLTYIVSSESAKHAIIYTDISIVYLSIDNIMGFEIMEFGSHFMRQRPKRRNIRASKSVMPSSKSRRFRLKSFL